MASIRSIYRPMRLLSQQARAFSRASQLRIGDREHPTQPEHRKIQSEKPLGPHMTNTNSTNTQEMPTVGSDKPPPEFLSSIDSDFAPKDSKPENTERMTGGTQKGEGQPPSSASPGELGVGEMEGAQFKVEPLRRTGEDIGTIRSRLLYQSRKRGTLEADLLMSTFADANLTKLNIEQLRQYDLILDENDWDLYYWATQEPSITSMETAEGAGSDWATKEAGGSPRTKDEPTPSWQQGGAKNGEWAQTVGAFKPAYRPVPARWKDSEILKMLRQHVLDRSAGGLDIKDEPSISGKGLAQGVKSSGGGGLGRMPEVRQFS